MRRITKQIFWGGADCKPQSEKTHQILNDAFSIQSGLQQPGHPDSEQAAKEEEDLLEKMESELKDCALDILTALGVKPESLIS